MARIWQESNIEAPPERLKAYSAGAHSPSAPVPVYPS